MVHAKMGLLITFTLADLAGELAIALLTGQATSSGRLQVNRLVNALSPGFIIL